MKIPIKIYSSYCIMFRGTYRIHFKEFKIFSYPLNGVLGVGVGVGVGVRVPVSLPPNPYLQGCQCLILTHITVLSMIS